MDGHPIRGVIMIVVLMALNAIMEAMVTALENVSVLSAEKRASEGERRAKQILSLLKNRSRYITVADLVCISCIAGMAASYLKNLLPALLTALLPLFPEYPAIASVLAGVITVLLIMLVELCSIKIPKRAAFRHAEGYASATVGILRLFMMLFSPFAWFLEVVSSGFLGLFRIKPSEEEKVTEEELLSTVTEAQETGILEAEEAEMIHNIFEFDQKEVNDIMTHRKHVVAVNVDMSLAEAMNFMLEEPYTRFPVYEEALENIVGILHLKDVMALYIDSSAEELRTKTVKDAARDPYFVPDTQSLDVLFKDMQKRKIHMAIAVDEYGQTAGIVTMEDILEEIVGDIQDEYDEEEEEIMPQADGSFLVRGTANLEELSELTGLEVGETEFDTLNGLLISELGHIPLDGERAAIEYNEYLINILETKNKTITLVRMKKLPKAELSEASED